MAIDSDSEEPTVLLQTEWEKSAVVAFHGRYPLEGYRRLAYMMLDAAVVAVSPSSVYRVLKAAGQLAGRRGKPSRKGQGFEQPLLPHEHWHIDVTPADKLAGRAEAIWAARKQKLATANARRRAKAETEGIAHS